MTNSAGTVFVPGGAQFQGAIPAQSITSATNSIERDWTYTKDGFAEDLDALHLTPVAGKDNSDISRYIKTDEEGNLVVTIIGEDGSGSEIELSDLLTTAGLKIVDLEGEDNRILKELKKMNLHLSLMTDEHITNQEVE